MISALADAIPPVMMPDYFGPGKMRRDKAVDQRLQDDIFHPKFRINQKFVETIMRFNYPEKHVLQSLTEITANHASTCYYLMEKN